MDRKGKASVDPLGRVDSDSEENESAPEEVTPMNVSNPPSPHPFPTMPLSPPVSGGNGPPPMPGVLDLVNAMKASGLSPEQINKMSMNDILAHLAPHTSGDLIKRASQGVSTGLSRSAAPPGIKIAPPTSVRSLLGAQAIAAIIPKGADMGGAMRLDPSALLGLASMASVQRGKDQNIAINEQHVRDHVGNMAK